jgi:ABC-type multidrug transport system fused ATPase/permease subunit
LNVRDAIRASLDLLSRRDRRRFFVVVILQMSTAFLDLLGVLLLGVVVALASSAATGQPVPATVSRVTSLLPIGDSSAVALAGWLALAAGLLLVTKSALSALFTRRILTFLANRQARVSRELAAALMSQSLLFVQSRSSQEVAYALTTGATAATLSILSSASSFLSEGALLGVLAAGLLVLDPWVTIFTVVFFVGVALALQRTMSSRTSSFGAANAEAEIGSVVTVQEAMKSYREVAVSSRRAFYVDRFGLLREQSAAAQANLAFVNAAPKYVLEVALVFGSALLVVSQVLTKDLSAALATITVTLVAATRIIPSLLRLQQGMLSIRWASGAAAATFGLVGELRSPDATSADMLSADLDGEVLVRAMEGEHLGFRGEVSVEHVSFRYPAAESDSISGISMRIPVGSSIALVGVTGSGKSTLTDLILGLLEPETGSILIDGRPPTQAIRDWPGAIAYVPQEVAMVNGAVRDNVALGLPSEAIDDDRVLEALRRAHLDQFLLSGREGINTVVGEHGVKLSGGQRQRLGIARALYTRPRLIVLDEATSALDAETERDVTDTLRELSGQVTAITIAHRLATVQHCDQVAYLERGHLAAIGTFAEVRAAVPRFDQQARLLGL